MDTMFPMRLMFSAEGMIDEDISALADILGPGISKHSSIFYPILKGDSSCVMQQ
jgi:hypothetical protein